MPGELHADLKAGYQPIIKQRFLGKAVNEGRKESELELGGGGGER
jgi:hypothetical protein